MKLNPLVHNVIWPAVAAAFSGHSSKSPLTQTLLARARLGLAALLAIGVYLAIDWVDTDEVRETINENYWCSICHFAASLATFAVATQFGARWAGWPLAAGFAVAIIGHCFGAWDLQSKASSWKARLTMAGFNALGLLVLLIGTFVEGPCAPWRTPWPSCPSLFCSYFFKREYRLGLRRPSHQSRSIGIPSTSVIIYRTTVRSNLITPVVALPEM